VADQNFRVGVLGCGQVSQDHFVAWQRSKGARVVACCDPDRPRAEKRATDFNVEKVYTDPQEMMDREKLDLVDIITPRETHADMVRLAARHRVNALCEKPFCPTYDEGVVVLREIADNIRVMVNENWRYRPYYTRIGNWIKKGTLGQIMHYRISLKRSNLIPNADGVLPALIRQPFMAKEDRLVIAECLIHELDITRSLIGEMSVLASRIARATTVIKAEDTATIMLETKGGVTAVVEGVLSSAGYPIRAGNRLEISGTRCSVILDDAHLRLFGAENEEEKYDEAEMRQKCFDLSIQHFIDQTRSGQPYWTSAEDQLNTLKLVEEAYRLAGPLRSHTGVQ
jgi:predicted dehydrogenase